MRVGWQVNDLKAQIERVKIEKVNYQKQLTYVRKVPHPLRLCPLRPVSNCRSWLDCSRRIRMASRFRR